MGSTEGFFAAIEAGSTDEVRAMLAAEPSLASARDEHGVSAVMRARYRFHPTVLEAVLSARPCRPTPPRGGAPRRPCARRVRGGVARGRRSPARVAGRRSVGGDRVFR